ncbi:MAG: hypothetical protein ACQER0_08865, partial [Bacillota bacterium]
MDRELNSLEEKFAIIDRRLEKEKHDQKEKRHYSVEDQQRKEWENIKANRREKNLARKEAEEW